MICKIRPVLAAAIVSLLPFTAGAAGYYLTDSGVRALGRADAFVAGADDLLSMWYNPAGLSEAGTQVLVDAGFIQYSSTFTRSSLPVASSNSAPTPQSFPCGSTTCISQGVGDVLPLPTLGLSSNFGLKTWNFAFGAHAPYVPLPEYQATLYNGTTVQTPAPQRYSLISPSGSALVEIGLYASKSFFNEQLSVGLGPELLVGQVSTRLAMTACPPGSVVCTEQQPSWDAMTQLNAGIVVSPSLALGAIYRINPMWRIGLSGQLPYWIDTGASLKIQLPSAAEFNNATVTGGSAEVKMALPAIIRLGIEARPVQGLRIEFATVYEGWQIHDKIDILPAKTNGVAINGVTGFPSPYPVGEMIIPQDYHDTANFRLGGEYFGGSRHFGYVLRAGGQFQLSAIPDNHKSVADIDPNRFLACLGVGLKFGGLSVDVSYAHEFAFDVNVNPATAAMPALSPVRGNATPSVAVNGGHYTETSNIFGAGVAYKF